MRSTWTRSLGVGLTLTVLAACMATPADDPVAAPPTATDELILEALDQATAQVGEGDGVRLEVGSSTIEIAPGSLAGAGELRAEQVTVDPDAELPDGIVVLGEGLRISLMNIDLVGAAEVSFRVPDTLDPDELHPIVVWEDEDGHLQWQPGAWELGDSTITATLGHFSLGFLAGFDMSGTARQWATNATNYFTGRSGVAQPSCGDEAAVRRSDRVVHSDRGDSVKWCFGLQDGQQVLRVANNRRSYVEITHPESWEVIGGGRYGMSLGAFHRFLATGAARWIAPAGLDVRLVAGGDTLVLAVPDGASGSVQVQMSVTAWLLSALQFGVDVYGSVSSAASLRLGEVSSGRWTHFARGMAGFESIGAWGDAARSCLRSYTDVITDQPIPEDMAVPVLKFVWGCVPHIMKADIEESGFRMFGLGAVLTAVGTVTSTVLTGVHLIITGIREIWDSFASLGGNSDAIYDIVIGAELPSPFELRDRSVPMTVDGPTQILVVDTSGSMSAQTDGRTRIEGARAALLEYLEQVEPGSRLGLRTYPAGGGCDSGQLRIPVAERDPASMAATIRTLTPGGNTPTAEALLAAAQDLLAAGAPHGTIVLVSDGGSTCAPPCEAASEIRAAGIDITIHAIGLAPDQGAVDELTCIAGTGGGRYADADDTDQLAVLLDEIALPALELELDHPTRVVAEVGTDASGLVRITATVTNPSVQTARDLRVRIIMDGTVAVGSPTRFVGNLAPRTTRTVDWQFRPGVTLAGQRVRFEVVVTGANLRNDPTATGSIQVVDATGRADAGPVLADAQRIAVLGDSYSSGEGAGDYLAGTDTWSNTCHRSSRTYLVAAFGLDPGAILACSGAVAADITAPNGKNGVPAQVVQLDRLQSEHGPVDAVVLTLGGNDIGFSSILMSCLLSPVPCTDRIGTHNTTAYLRDRLSALPETLWETYGAIDAVLNRPDRVTARGARAPIVVLAYPRIFPGAKRPCAALTGFSQEELDLGSELVTRLNGAIEAAVRVAWSRGVPTLFVPTVEDAFLPHNTICDGERAHVRSPSTIRLPEGSTLGDVLGARITRGTVSGTRVALHEFGTRIQELYHPNEAGYQAVTRAVIRWSLTEDANVDLPAGPARSTIPVTVDRPSDQIRGVITQPGPNPDLQGGHTYQVQGSGFMPDALVDVTLRSRLRVLAVADADARGLVEVTVTIPHETEPGDHVITIAGLDPDAGPHLIEIPVVVTGEPGIPVRYGLMAGSVLLVLAGLALTLRRRRPGDDWA